MLSSITRKRYVASHKNNKGLLITHRYVDHPKNNNFLLDKIIWILALNKLTYYKNIMLNITL